MIKNSVPFYRKSPDASAAKEASKNSAAYPNSKKALTADLPLNQSKLIYSSLVKNSNWALLSPRAPADYFSPENTLSVRRRVIYAHASSWIMKLEHLLINLRHIKGNHQSRRSLSNADPCRKCRCWREKPFVWAALRSRDKHIRETCMYICIYSDSWLLLLVFAADAATRGSR